MTTFRRLSLAGGEIAPSIHPRVDLVDWQTGLALLSNAFTPKTGGAQGRPGTRQRAEVKDSSKRVRLKAFIFSESLEDQNYLLEVGHHYIRFFQDGEQLLEDTSAITGISLAAQAVVTAVAHGLENGDEIFLSGAAGLTELNGENLIVADKTDDTFKVKYLDGTYVDSTAFGTWTSGGTVARILEVETDYDEEDLFRLQFSQSFDVIEIAHLDYPTMALKRLGHTDWTFELARFRPSIDPPSYVGGTAGAAGDFTFRYRVLAVDALTDEQSWYGLGEANAITGVSVIGDEIVIASVAHTLKDGDEILIEDLVGPTSLNNRLFIVTTVAANSFRLLGESGAGLPAWVSGGTAKATHITVDEAAEPTPDDPHTITWEAPATGTPRHYIVFKSLNGIYGFVAIAHGLSYDDEGATPDQGDTPAEAPYGRDELGQDEDSYPAVVAFAQARRFLANTRAKPETIFGSQIDQHESLTAHRPKLSEDGLEHRLRGGRRGMNEIRHLIDIGTLIAFTASGVWALRGDDRGTITPFDIGPRQYSDVGSSYLPPIPVDGGVLYLTRYGQVQNIAYRIEDDSYGGRDISLRAAHLFEGHEIVDWAWTNAPHPIAWMVRDDGLVIGMTYIPGEEVRSCHRHDFAGGFVESVCVVPDGIEDVLYLLVRRTINGRTVRYVESMTSSIIDEDSQEDLVFMDSTRSYDGRNVDPDFTIEISGGVDYDDTEQLTATASEALWKASDVGNQLHLEAADGSKLILDIIGYTSPTVVTVRTTDDVPEDLQETPTAAWTLAVDFLSGLRHLAGEQVSVFADADVVSSPNNPRAGTVLTVTPEGTLQLPGCFGVIHVGLPFIGSLKTLRLDSAESETLLDKAPLISAVALFVEKTRGLWAGAAAPADDSVDPSEGLREYKGRTNEAYGSPIALFTGVTEVTIGGNYYTNGIVFIRQLDPLPWKILSLMPCGNTGMPPQRRGR